MPYIIDCCPVCGNPLLDETVATFPPIPRKVCYACGYTWEGTPEPVEYRTFNPDNPEFSCLQYTNDK